MSARGTTLIEMMIVVSMTGILVGVFATSVSDVHRNAAYVQNRERAWQVLDYEADAIVHGVASDAATRERLLARLPGGKYRAVETSGTTRLEVRWTVGAREETESLVVVGSPR